MGVKRFNTAVVTRDIQAVIRTFPSMYVEIRRATRTFTNLGSAGLNLATSPMVYQGEALEIPEDGSLYRYPLGEVHIDGYGLLINGKRDIQQGDFVTLPNGRLYTVKEPKPWWQVWTLVTLQKYQQ